MNDTSKPSDGDLLAVFAGTGDEAAFAELIGRHGAMVQGVCLRVLGNFHEAQDVTQAVFVTLARKAASLRKDPSVGGWLHHVALCLARNVRAANHSRQRREEQAMHEVEVSAEPCVVDTRALRAELDDAIGRLPERYRLPLVLFHLEERSLEQTAQALALNIKTASTRLVRGREMLRKKLIRRGVTVGAISALTTLLSAEAGAAVLPATFVSATVQAASLAAAGKLAAGIGTGVVSAKVAALTKGALQMMFIAQLKTAALITAACVVVAGSGAIVAKEVLTPPATPATVQAEPKGLPPTPATNAEATIAWGAVTNELQAGLVPLGGVKGGAWGEEQHLFFCPKCAYQARKHCMDPSVAADKRACAICGAPKPWSATFIEGEPMRMELHFRNLAKEERSLYDARYNGEYWSFTFTEVRSGKVWKTSWSREEERTMEWIARSTISLAVGQQNAVEMGLERHSLSLLNPDGGRPASRTLPPGKYTVTASYAHPGKYAVHGNLDSCAGHEQGKPCTYWHGTVTTGPVVIEIVPATTSAVKHAFGQLPLDARKTLGAEGWLFIRSQARLDQVLEQFHTVEKPVRLPPVDFDKEMVFCHYALHDPDDKDEVVACTGDAQRLTLSLLQGIVGNRDGTPMPKMHVVFCVVPKTKEFRLTTAQWVGASSPLLDAATARKDVTFDRTFAPEQGDVVAGLRGSIRAEKNEIQPGEDIKVEFKLEWDDANAGRKQAAACASQPVYVWDGKYSEGYRNHAFLVETPDGKTELLRRPGQLEWAKNIPHPVEIKDGNPYVLPGWIEGHTWKSLKALGLDTTKPGVYKVTGIYMETAEETDGMAGRKPDGGKYQMWGGNLAANTVAIRVGDAR